MRKSTKKALAGVVAGCIVFVAYTVWDNQRLTIAEQDIKINDLPKQLENFTILQISDLHEEEFGKGQKRFIEKINSIDYDAIVFTGDILDNNQSTNYDPFYTLLDGIEDKENLYYVFGNADPPSYQVNTSLEKSEFIKGMEERGVTFLESIDTIDVNGATIRFVNFELAIIQSPEYVGSIAGVIEPAYVSDENYLAHQEKLLKEMDTLDRAEDTDVLVALNHFPVVDARIDYIQQDPMTRWRDFDLIIAGHYHGGQIRIPFLGAVFVPEAWYSPTSFFPPRDRVSGLWEYNGTKQYVSTGIGSSDAIPFLKFRLFNPPQINLLRFTRE
jgi:predicted MPP superfamily phosphohydrolase